ncbi:MAG: zinc metallopeptidase [Bacteroidales bacterium]|nr:zinc metallopeptidase [Bacteroidales bacterium]MBR1578029.1 zinc metallopeptidase [Bacteroidales bacterium]
MRLDGRRQSTNVDDRRGMSGGAMAAGGIGLGGLLIIGVISLLMGRNPVEVLQQVGGMSGTEIVSQSGRTPTAEEQELAEFTLQILASTEDVWTKVFKQYGREYVAPQLVLYNDYVQTASGTASAQMGPFYNSADQKVYIDLSFFSTMKQEIGADGDFAYAYVIAHEIGHHVQYLLGILQQAHQQMARMSQTDSNHMSVRIELQADFLAGVWAHYENKMFSSLEDGDLEEGITLAAKIGDDYLQKKARGYATPDTFNHGTSQQRERWLLKGFRSGDINQGDTFSVNYNQL